MNGSEIGIFGTCRHVYSDDRKSNECDRIEPFCALRSVPKRQQETHDEKTEVYIVKNKIENVDAIAKVERWVLHRFAQDSERDVVIALSIRV